MKGRAKNPRAIYILKEFWPRDKNENWEDLLYTVNLFVKIQYIHAGEKITRYKSIWELYSH